MKNITFQEFLKKYNSNDHIILDIRKKEKFIDDHFPNAIHFVMGDILTNSHILDKNKEIYIYCNSGNSSKLATNILSNLGYNAYNLDGGFTQYLIQKNIKYKD